MTGSRHHQLYALLTVLGTIATGVIVIPLVRSQPEALNSFAKRLHGWQRADIAFLLCVLFAYTMYTLLSPRLAHLKFVWTHPPTWAALLVGVIVVGAVDVCVGLDPSGYRATWGEWLFYAGGSTTLVLVFWRLSHPQPIEQTTTPPDQKLSLQNLAKAKWQDIEEWLRSDAPAKYDFLDNRAVAERLVGMLLTGSRSIGLVGPFGAGKTSIVKWVSDEVANRRPDSPHLFISKHSCWAFRTSASSIHEMLTGSIRTIERAIDTFCISSLPDAYRKTFSAAGEWIDKISNLVIHTRDPSEQFEALSELLGDLNARLVLVVEDLDRNDSRSFDIQEVLAFLEQLKEYKNLAFVLTGGLSSSLRIDFAKLCDHIEYLKMIDVGHVAALVERVSGRCTDTSVFPHEALADPARNYKWNPLSGMMMRDYEELSLPQAVASLLNTPRSLRHTLGRTWAAWKSLHGEIDLNHLLAVNVLRFGAPECFQFLVRRWDRVREPPSSSPSFGRERVEQIRQAIASDWNSTIEKVEWNPTAALVVMEFILPASNPWLVKDARGGTSNDAPQGVQHERYWRRAVNESIDSDDVRDQVVIRNLRQWLKAPSVDAEMIVQICKSEAYSDIWEHLAIGVLAGNAERILLICEHALTRISREHGSAASDDSQGFAATWRIANRRVSLRPENQQWLETRISEAAPVSLRLVNSLWHFYATGQYALLPPANVNAVRQHEIGVLQSVFVDGPALERSLDSRYPWTLYQLVFDPDAQHPNGKVEEMPRWTWLSPLLLDSLRRGSFVVTSEIAHFIATRVSNSRQESWTISPAVLFGFFPNDAAEVVRRLMESASRILDKEQQAFVKSIAESAETVIQRRAENT
jgi:hypothetical protein